MPDRAPISHPDFEPVELRLVQEPAQPIPGTGAVPVSSVQGTEEKVQEGSQAHPERVEEKRLSDQIGELIAYEAGRYSWTGGLADREAWKKIGIWALEAIDKLNFEVNPRGTRVQISQDRADLERLVINYISRFVRTKVTAPRDIGHLFPSDELGSSLVRDVILP